MATGQNWFAGLPVPAEGWFERLPDVPPGFRRFHPGDLHLTVAFFGPVDERAARAGWDALDWALGAVEASLGPVVPLGNPHRYSALSATLAEGRERIEEAMARVRDGALKAAGRPAERRAPLAHLTLARPKRSATAHDRRAGLAWAQALDLSGVTLRLEGVALYTWSEDRSERLFRVVDRRPGSAGLRLGK